MLTKLFSTDGMIMLGERVQRADEAPSTLPGKRRLGLHLFEDKATGRMSYEPPLPDVPRHGVPSEPPKSVIDETVWKSEAPPAPDWYIASRYGDSRIARYWDGNKWFLDSKISNKRDHFLQIQFRATSAVDIKWLRRFELPAA